jgi:alkylated DNA repair dioxygenase AlkB
LEEQNELFLDQRNSSARLTHELGNATIQEFPFAFNERESNRYLTSLIDKIPWQQDSLWVGGKEVLIPRLQCWMGDQGSDYSYSGIRLQPKPWSEDVLNIKTRIESLAEHKFNSVLLNYYRNGQDSVSWHADDEKELGDKPIIASISFGAVRKFQFRAKFTNGAQKFNIELRNGSLLLMGDTLQNNWLHQLPKASGLGKPRINLTFRRIY